MSKEIVEKIKNLLNKNNIEYKLFIHEPVYTSKQAALVRKVDIKTGVKALLLKNKEFILALIPANKKLNIKKLSSISKLGRLSFASPQEVIEKTDCEIGSVPPFNFNNIKTYADKEILENEFINFNTGLHTHSIKMKSQDLFNLIKPTIVEISQSSS